jgi:uncharacterized protein (TIGR00296 family)
VYLTPDQGKALVSIARTAVEQAAEGGEPAFGHGAPPRQRFLEAKRGAFVTLSTLEGQLRGCIGFPYPFKPLGEAVFESAVGAATRDPRFPRVEPRELASLRVEVSALTQPEEVAGSPEERPRSVRVGRDGLMIVSRGGGGLLLPQVGVELGVGPEEFLSLTCEKAGLPPDAWLRPEVRVLRFQAEVFCEAPP